MIKQAWLALLLVRKEMVPYLEVPADKTEEAKKLCLASMEQFKGILKVKKGTAVAVTHIAYEMFRLFVIGDQHTHWDKIVQEMHTKDPLVGVNGVTHKGIRLHSWSAFLDCIKLHKLTIFPIDAAEKQRYYMMQTVKKP